jgi:hypothetical protein
MRLKGRRRLHALILAASLAAFASACPQTTAVWIDPGASASSLAFNLGKERGVPDEVSLNFVVVSKCDPVASSPDSGMVWRIVTKVRPQRVKVLRYGEPPPGFTVQKGPHPLVRGCYTIQISGTGATEFLVNDIGAVTDRGSPW